MTKIFSSLKLGSGGSLSGVAKVGLGTDGSIPPDLPSFTTTERNALTGSAGMTLWNTTTQLLEIYNGSSWISVGRSEWIMLETVSLSLSNSGQQFSTVLDGDTHKQYKVRIIAKTSADTDGGQIALRINNDTGDNYKAIIVGKLGSGASDTYANWATSPYAPVWVDNVSGFNISGAFNCSSESIITCTDSYPIVDSLARATGDSWDLAKFGQVRITSQYNSTSNITSLGVYYSSSDATLTGTAYLYKLNLTG